VSRPGIFRPRIPQPDNSFYFWRVCFHNSNGFIAPLTGSGKAQRKIPCVFYPTSCFSPDGNGNR
jgi:hypothetical protein